MRGRPVGSLLGQTRLRVLLFIRDYITEHGYPPSVQDICDGVGLASKSSAHTHLLNLERDGLIRRDANKNRAMVVL